MIFDRLKNHAQNPQLIKLCDRCREYLIDQLTNTLPESGKLKQGCRASFTNLIKQWSIHKCGLGIVQSYKGDDMRALEIFATFPDGSGYEMKNFLIHGTNAELKSFLQKDTLVTEMIETFESFSAGISEKM